MPSLGPNFKISFKVLTTMELKNNNFPIKSWAESDRPREKLIQFGRHSLSDSELLAILIGSGNKEETALDLSKRMLAANSNNLQELAKKSLHDLMDFKGIGEAKAITIIAALEFGRRKAYTPEVKKKQITSSREAYDYVKPMLLDLNHEEFWVIFLNRANAIIKSEIISRGGVAGTVVDSKLIFKSAIAQLANAIILCHNHPSGNTKPSEQDIQITKKLVQAGKLMEIPILDHIIFTNSAYYSFADEGLL